MICASWLRDPGRARTPRSGHCPRPCHAQPSPSRGRPRLSSGRRGRYRHAPRSVRAGSCRRPLRCESFRWRVRQTSCRANRILLGLLSHEPNVGHATHGRRIELSVLFAVLDHDLIHGRVAAVRDHGNSGSCSPSSCSTSCRHHFDHDWHRRASTITSLGTCRLVFPARESTIAKPGRPSGNKLRYLLDLGLFARLEAGQVCSARRPVRCLRWHRSPRGRRQLSPQGIGEIRSAYTQESLNMIGSDDLHHRALQMQRETAHCHL